MRTSSDHGRAPGPHPHINLVNVTYVFKGEILHRDSLGSEVAIRPGAVNWMTAGRGIVHSERMPEALRGGGSRLFGLQTWVALPAAHEESRARLCPQARGRAAAHRGRWRARAPGGRLRLGPQLAGAGLLRHALCDVALAAGGKLPVDAAHSEESFAVWRQRAENSAP